VAGYYVLPAAGGQLYHPTQPFRLYDSRRDARGALGNNAARTLTLPTIDGTPAEGMGAAVVNVTAVGAAGTGYLTVHPAGSRRPAASTLNFAGRATVSNRAAAKLSGGALTVTNRGSGVHVVVDVVGWFADPVVAGGHAYRPLAPVRVLDTRSGKGAARAPVGPGTTLSLTVAGAGRPLPADASAVVMTLTSTGATAPTYVTAWPAGAARPATSDLNVRARQTTANLVVVPVGSAGAISLFNRFGSTHLVGDVVGYYR
jgi:hypothetical protein